MINGKEELLHDIRVANFIEAYRFSCISKRDKWYSFSNIEWDPILSEIKIEAIINFNDSSYTINQIIRQDTIPKKSIGNQRFKYTILEPLKESKIFFKESDITGTILIQNNFPYYDVIHHSSVSLNNVENMFNFYSDRCKAKVSVELHKKNNTTHKYFDCVGFREHSWGLYPSHHISCDSRVVVHFRDQTISFRYIEYNGMSYSYGCISKKSGNLALVLVELEFLSIKNSSFESSEFTYKDAQDDIDLIVSKPIKPHHIEVSKKLKKSHLHIISFSDFTVIGTNKKGYGIEEHLISHERLKNVL